MLAYTLFTALAVLVEAAVAPVPPSSTRVSATNLNCRDNYGGLRGQAGSCNEARAQVARWLQQGPAEIGVEQKFFYGGQETSLPLYFQSGECTIGINRHLDTSRTWGFFSAAKMLEALDGILWQCVRARGLGGRADLPSSSPSVPVTRSSPPTVAQLIVFQQSPGTYPPGQIRWLRPILKQALPRGGRSIWGSFAAPLLAMPRPAWMQ